MEILEKIINEGGNQFLIDEKEEEKEEKSIINCEGESKKEEEEENQNQNININRIKEDKILTKSDNSPKNDENQYNNNSNNNININKNKKLINDENKRPRLRASSAKRENENKKEEELTNINNSNRKFPRAMSAHVMRPLEKKNDCYVHNIYLSSRNKLGHKNIFRNNYNKIPQRNKLNDIFDENKKGNTSSQISTYEGINNSIYEKQNIPRHGFPYKNNHQIQNKMYLKINKRLKQKQYEKDQKKLEEFSKLIHLDDAFLSEDILKEKFDINNSVKNNHNNINNDLLFIDKNKLFKRPFSAYRSKIEKNMKKEKNLKNNNFNGKAHTPKLFKFNKNNNFRAVSKKSSNENSKIEFTTSVLNTKHEYFLNNKSDKVTFVYFNDIIEMKPQSMNDIKPIVRNDGIIVASNYFNRGKPQLLTYRYKNKTRKYLVRTKSGKNIGSFPKLKDNVIIQEEHLGINKKIENKRSSNKKIMK